MTTIKLPNQPKLTVATHLIKITGIFDKNIYNDQEKLKDYVKLKIKNEIDNFYHTDLELFKVEKNKINVWVFIRASPSEAKREIIDKWLKCHIKEEEGINIIDFEIEEKVNLYSLEETKDFLILIP